MTEELFPPESVAMDSPRLAWLKRHGCITMSFEPHQRFGEFDRWIAGFAEGVAGKDAIAQWFCEECGKNGETTIGMGATEDEAIAELAIRYGVRLWNESS